MQRSAGSSFAGSSGEPPRYLPIGDYGAIGDCRTAALVAPNGSIDWLCLPHFDSPAIFCRLLDADRGGFFRVAPEGDARASMVYAPGTNILETTFDTDSGRLRLIDFMPIRRRQASANPLRRIGARFSRSRTGIAAGFERALGNDVAAAHRVNRIVSCLEGEVSVALTLKVTFDYARRAPTLLESAKKAGIASAILTDGARYVALVVRCGETPSGATGEIDLEGEAELLRLRAPLVAGQGLIAALNYARNAEEARHIRDRLATHAFAADLDETRSYWQGWAAHSVYAGPYQDAVQRSALALKLCTFEPTGAIVAAPTTSLPEWIGGVRNWDYRYTWLRDSSFTVDALGRLGYYDEARDYVHFLHDLNIKSGDQLRIMYGIRGEYGDQLSESELTHLEGYGGSRPVRIGNGAADQRQLDVYGELLNAAYAYVTHAGFRSEHRRVAGPDRDLRRLASLIADYVAAHWRDLDQGIWEVRGKPRAFVYSRAMCWVALDRACRLADGHGASERAKRWRAAAEDVRRDVLENGYDRELGSFLQAYGADVAPALDAANLRLPLAGFVPPDAAEARGTVEATKRALAARRALLYRYRSIDAKGDPLEHQDGDGLPGREGTFLACAFWLVEALCREGAVDEARERFEQLLSFAGPLGLFAEEVDAESGALLGNYPQAYTHIGLITSAVMLHQAQEGRPAATDGDGDGEG
jgi:GH15 family glucan-1,4-alpha-glucosidase